MSQLQVTGEAKIRDIQGPVVANSGVITALDGAASQYVRGDGTLADFPTSTGGGSSVSYYLNGSINQGTFAGSTYYEMSKTPIIGAGTDFPVSTNGLVAQFITDANDPDLLEVPGGNFNVEFYFSVSNNTGNPTVYAELYKYDGTTFTLLGSSVAVPESLNQGTTIAPYYFAIPVGTAALALTDRIAIRIYANVDGRTVTLHTENSHLCQVVTTFSKGMVSLNNLTDQSQFITTGTSGTNFNIVSSGDTHTFNLPVASATNTGKLSNTDWSTFNNKVPYTGATTDVDLGFNNFDANHINGFKIIAKLDGTSSGSLILRTGTSGYSYGNDSISLISSPTSANTLTIVSDISSVTKIAQFGLGSLTATRTFTLPDASGTIALTSNLSDFVTLSTYQTITANKTFSGWIQANTLFLSNSSSVSSATGFGTLTYNKSGSVSTLRITNDNNATASLIFDNTTNYNYTYPATSGTIALTSNIPSVSGTSTYIPVFTGTNSLGNSQIWNNGGIIGMGTNYSSPAFYVVASSGDTLTQGKLAINTTSFSGTSVLQVNGAATLTGALSGTSASFSSSVTANSTSGISGTFTSSNFFGSIDLENTGGTATGKWNLQAVSGAQVGGSAGSSFGIYSYGASAYRLFINSSGSVGIGTISPSNLLHVSSTSGTLIKLQGSSTGNNTNSIQGVNGNGDIFELGIANAAYVNSLYPAIVARGSYLYSGLTLGLIADGSSPILFQTGGSERMRITSSGYVLINTTSSNGWPLEIQSLAGGEQIYLKRSAANAQMFMGGVNAADTLFYIRSNGSGGVVLSSGATSWASASDERLKNINNNIEDAVGKLQTLRAVNFAWKKDKTNKNNLGLIAQDVEKVFPEVISFDKERDEYSVRYTELIPVLVKAIQESHQIIKDLEARIVTLESKIN